jgi:glycosyltransferase involved in cell wall biosynthesis
MKIKQLDTAVIHPNWGIGGAEHVAEEITRTFDADLYYCYSEDGGAPDDSLQPTKLFGQSIPSKFSPYRNLKYMMKGTHISSLYDYDIVIQTGNETGWYVPKDDQVIIRYLHSTPRLPYDQFWRTSSRFVKLYTFIIRILYMHTIPFVDKYIVNSDIISRRAKKFWGISENKLSIVYPPVDINMYTANKVDDSYYIFVSRLEKEKRVMETINAFDNTDYKLIIVGDGSLSSKVDNRTQDVDNITHKGYVSEDKKIELIEHAKALIYPPMDEDFGLVPIESMAAGTPVITVPEGFPKHVVRHGYNGVISDTADSEGIAKAVRLFDDKEMNAEAEDMRSIAERFRLSRFREEMMSEVKKEVDSNRISPEIV